MNTRAGTNPLRTPGMRRLSSVSRGKGQPRQRWCIKEVGILSRGVKREFLLARKGSIKTGKERINEDFLSFRGAVEERLWDTQAVSKNLKIAGAGGDLWR